MKRRNLLSISAVAVAALAAAPPALAQTATGMKLTVLYGHPKSPEDFEKYYAGTHMPLVAAVKDLRRFETSKGMPKADGAAPAFYRMFEAWFENPEQMTAVTSSPEWKKVGADLANFATGGVTSLVSKVE